MSQAVEIVSLGANCYTAWGLKEMAVKRASYPFDWIFSSPGMALDMLRDDFGAFLDRRHYRTRPLDERAEPTINLCDHVLYRERHDVPAIFNHRDPNEDAAYAYYGRAVERFRRVATGADPVLFVMTAWDKLCEPAIFRALAAELEARGANNRLLAINLAPPDPASVGMAPLDALGPHRLLAFTPSSRLHAGLWHEAWQDDEIVRDAVRRAACDLADQKRPEYA